MKLHICFFYVFYDSVVFDRLHFFWDFLFMIRVGSQKLIFINFDGFRAVIKKQQIQIPIVLNWVFLHQVHHKTEKQYQHEIYVLEQYQ